MAKSTGAPVPLGMVLVRVVTGAVLARQGWSWLTRGGLDGRTVRASVEEALPHLSSLAAWWGEELVLANPDAFAFFWRWGALLVGVLLVAGALTRPAGALAVLFLAHGLVYGPAERELLFVLLATSCLAVSVSGAGRRLGLDAMFDQHFPGWLTWTRGRRAGFLS